MVRLLFKTTFYNHHPVPTTTASIHARRGPLCSDCLLTQRVGAYWRVCFAHCITSPTPNSSALLLSIKRYATFLLLPDGPSFK
ncbi:hypothetical protein NX059_006972 [Plenodomus lindquistii]|nr:hypothetical protein NX059_006972 [Plenodomus lindquistii]